MKKSTFDNEHNNRMNDQGAEVGARIDGDAAEKARAQGVENNLQAQITSGGGGGTGTIPNNLTFENDFSSPLYYGGNLPLMNGQPHKYSEIASGNWMAGATSISDLCAKVAPNGTTPFAWRCDNGTTTGKYGTYGTNTRNPFIDNEPAAIGDQDVTILALQSALLASHHLKVPPGIAITTRPLVKPIVVDYPADANGIGYYQQAYSIDGSGQTESQILKNTDAAFGPVLICGDPTATPQNALGVYNYNAGQCRGHVHNIMFGFTGFARQAFNVGHSTVQNDCIKNGSRMDIEHVWLDGCNAGIGNRGDHKIISDVHFMNTYDGINQDDDQIPSVLYGDDSNRDLTMNPIHSCFRASNSTISGMAQGKSYCSAMNFMSGRSGSGKMIATGFNFDSFHLENLRQSVIMDENVLPGEGTNGTAYHYEKLYRGLTDFTSTTAWQLGINPDQDANIVQGYPNYKRCFLFTYGETDHVDLAGLAPQGLNPSPAQGTSGFYCGAGGFFTGTQVGTFGGGLRVAGAFDAFLGPWGTLPFWTDQYGNGLSNSGPFLIEEPGHWTGEVVPMAQVGNRNATVAGEGVEFWGQDYRRGAISGSNNNNDFSAHPIGVSLITGCALPGFCPTITHSGQLRNLPTPDQSAHWHSVMVAMTGIKGITIDAGGMITSADGPYSWVANCQGFGATAATGTVQVTNHTIVSGVTTNHGSHCTGVPTVNISGITGSGYVVTAGWPAGVFSIADPAHINTINDGSNNGTGTYNPVAVYGYGHNAQGASGTSTFSWDSTVEPSNR